MRTNSESLIQKEKDSNNLAFEKNESDILKTMNRDIDTIIGFAYNEKVGAIVRNRDSIYFISNLDVWDDFYINKKVKVIGNIKMIYNQSDSICDDYTDVIQQAYPKEFMITNATWEVFISDK